MRLGTTIYQEPKHKYHPQYTLWLLSAAAHLTKFTSLSIDTHYRI